MNLVDTLFGRPLATEEEKAERIGPLKGIPIFGLDALSSAAYGPEAALTLLIPLGMAGAIYVWPITIGIVVLLGIVYFSYRQTIAAYPQGGGSYTVASGKSRRRGGPAVRGCAHDRLCAHCGRWNLRGSRRAGFGRTFAAARYARICLGILIVITLINLRGVRETGGVFLLPTYVFIACLLGLIGVGIFKTLAAGGHPVPVVVPPKLAAVTGTVSAWLLLRTFSSGCTAMTGVEAVSNGVMAFREPTDQIAKRTLTIIIAILIVMLLGIAYLVPSLRNRGDGSGHAGIRKRALAIAGRGHGPRARSTGLAFARSCWCCRFRPTRRLRISLGWPAQSHKTDTCRTPS